MDGKELFGEFRGKAGVYVFTTIKLIPQQKATTRYTQNE